MQDITDLGPNQDKASVVVFWEYNGAAVPVSRVLVSSGRVNEHGSGLADASPALCTNFFVYFGFMEDVLHPSA